ncbi:Ig domain-containing protein [Actinacidiphila sp. ITFR-21]|uniref:Ig domain-containing protein n=1 Tax=Actinacidiphila sp. ITFR-21 TaxID=3075199 RepID=UPI002889728D|nr:Ig domain-containing protein [Streptomyces sp. ITFR-21]WNI17619.1 Ig domain-containing protein [Streptomyces sp. ITFR-21]WNI17759.1 Ig domain-containing protein [Streptomyces sp. ITFR-21]
MPFLLNEDKALKLKFQGLMVHDSTSGPGRRITVRYRNPEYELADATYPLALISHTRISRDEERESRGTVNLHYAPEGYAPWADMSDPTQSPYIAQMPVPLNIDYQLDVYARKELHIIELTGSLMQFDFLPARFGYLPVGEDGTVRRLDLLGGPDYSESKDEQGKRLFCASWALRVSSEIFLSEIRELTPAQRVLIDFLDKQAWDAGTDHPLDPTYAVTKTALSITTTALPNATAGRPYRQELVAAGGYGETRWSLPEGSRLPAGLALSHSGALFGTPHTPTAGEPGEFLVAASDSDDSPQVTTAALTLTVSPAPPGSC